jgi:hypothetical protein
MGGVLNQSLPILVMGGLTFGFAIIMLLIAIIKVIIGFFGLPFGI